MNQTPTPNLPATTPNPTQRDMVMDRKRRGRRVWADRAPDNPVSPGNYREIDHE